MHRAAALLLALTFTGTPVTALACMALCGPSAVAAPQADCHGTEAPPADGPVLSTPDCCDLAWLNAPTAVKGDQRPARESVREPSMPRAPFAVPSLDRSDAGHPQGCPRDVRPSICCLSVVLRI